jgi:acetyltransferase-like isoleucine patch superfamily enzyme
MGKLTTETGAVVDHDDLALMSVTSAYRPENLRYDQQAVYIGPHRFTCDNPRLEFCRLMNHYPENNDMGKYFDSFVQSATKFEGLSTIGKGCMIGGIGFGYEYDEDGRLIRMPHHGIVRICSDVTIHNNVNIDRAVLGETVIGQGTKIDSLVHIAHGVKIGRYCLIVSGAVFGGSSVVGNRTFIGMNVSIKQKVKIGSNCVIGAGAVVTKDVPDGQVWVGNPARYLKDTEARKYPLTDIQDNLPDLKASFEGAIDPENISL